MFAPGVYERGALTLVALEAMLGTETFVRILRTYVDRFAHRNAATADFVAVAEEVSGVSLGLFFQRWLYDAPLPSIPELGLFNNNA
jgi:aminopeptidase N